MNSVGNILTLVQSLNRLLQLVSEFNPDSIVQKMEFSDHKIIVDVINYQDVKLVALRLRGDNYIVEPIMKDGKYISYMCRIILK